MDIILARAAPKETRICVLKPATFPDRSRSKPTIPPKTAALASIISIHLFYSYPSVNGVYGFDYHLIANIIVGIGFIGAGTILKRENKVEGTTTAASLWA